MTARELATLVAQGIAIAFVVWFVVSLVLMAGAQLAEEVIP